MPKRTPYSAQFAEFHWSVWADSGDQILSTGTLSVRVSVIIPAYNAATTLADAVTSIEDQTSQDWELLIVDDGSSDRTRLIAKDLAERDRRIRVITQENGGEGAARNTGIGQARYEWLLFLDADDWVAPTYMERLLSAVDADPLLDAVHCGWARVAQDGTEVIEEYRPPIGDLFPVLARRAAFPVHACLVRRSIVESVGLFDTHLKKSPDWDLWQRIARCGARFGGVSEVLAYYRMAQNSASLEADQMLRDGLTVLRRGHQADPRVLNPLPQYADGLPDSTVESQQYYLLCWCAGLLLGTGEDAARLLQLVNGERYTALYPNAIAQCIFDSAPLPACLARQDWEGLWRRISGPTANFLQALESQTQTPALANSALRELKKLILKNSATWADVIQHEEASVATLQENIAKMSEGSAWLASERDTWRLRAEAWERQCACTADKLSVSDDRAVKLAAEAAALGVELERSRTESQQELRVVEAKTDALTAQLDHATGRYDNLARRHAEAIEELSRAGCAIVSLEKRVASMDLNLVSEQARIKALEQRGESLDSELGAARSRVEELKHHSASMELTLASARARITELEQQGRSSEMDLIAMRERVQELEQRADYVAGEMSKWRESATARALLIDNIHQDAWMRLGLWLGTTKRREPAPASAELSALPESNLETSVDPAIEERWHLRVADRNEANLIYPREDHEMVKVGITRAETKTSWDIQLNYLGLKVAGGSRYSVAFRARSKRPREIGVGFAKAHDPWDTLGMYTTVQLTPEWQTFHEEFVALKDSDDARIHFDLGGRAVGVDLTSVSLRAVEKSPEVMQAAVNQVGADGEGR